MKNEPSHWDLLNNKSKRLVLLWLYILKTEPIEEITHSFLEPLWINEDKNIRPHLVPLAYFKMNPVSLRREIDKIGGFPSWTE